MKDKKLVISNIDLIHTTILGINRIKKNLKIDCDVVMFLKEKIVNPKSIIYKKGKNYYCEIDDIIITINSYSYCIITAHLLKQV